MRRQIVNIEIITIQFFFDATDKPQDCFYSNKQPQKHTCKLKKSREFDAAVFHRSHYWLGSGSVHVKLILKTVVAQSEPVMPCKCGIKSL